MTDQSGPSSPQLVLSCSASGVNSGPSRALHSSLSGAAGPSRDSPTVPRPLCLFAVISGDSLIRPVKMHCTGRWFLLPVTEPWTTLSVQAAGKERCPPHPPDLCTPIISAFTRVRCHAGSGGLPHNPVKKLCYDPRFTGREPRRREGQPSAEGCTARKCQVGRGPGISAPYLFCHAGLLLSSAPPGSHLHVFHVPITPWAAPGGSGVRGAYPAGCRGSV